MDVIRELLATPATAGKLGVRSISVEEARQILDNTYVIVRNPGRRPRRELARRLLIGRTDGGRVLTLVVERTADSATWVIVTGWSTTGAERMILERST